jgi:membrane-bound ClpP family serine protease
MRRLLPLAVVLSAALWPMAPARAQSAAHVTDVVKIDGIIDGRVEALIERRLQEAEEGGLLVLQINSPGTLDVDVPLLGERIASSKVPVVVWAGPPGSLLQGWAVVLLEAADVALTSPRSGIGPASVVDLGGDRPTTSGTGLPPSVRPADNQIALIAAGFARRHGRDPEAVSALFREEAEALPA